MFVNFEVKSEFLALALKLINHWSKMISFLIIGVGTWRKSIAFIKTRKWSCENDDRKLVAARSPQVYKSVSYLKRKLLVMWPSFSRLAVNSPGSLCVAVVRRRRRHDRVHHRIDPQMMLESQFAGVHLAADDAVHVHLIGGGGGWVGVHADQVLLLLVVATDF